MEVDRNKFDEIVCHGLVFVLRLSLFFCWAGLVFGGTVETLSLGDFDDCWRSGRRQLSDEVPMDARMDRLAERSAEAFDFYRISFATFGHRVQGVMSVPTDKAKLPCPVVVRASTGAADTMTGDADVINVQFSTSSRKEDFRADILGIDRAVDWVVSRPEVDWHRFWYQGASQDGGFGFCLVGLNQAFTRVVLFAPAELQECACTTNFAMRITCPVRVVVNSPGTACSSNAVSSVFNSLGSLDKAIFNDAADAKPCEWLRSSCDD